ncbi:MAG: PDZ domain-containing protein [Patescibacteria group bacterium]|jgi:S1-C subfamily serine protease
MDEKHQHFARPTTERPPSMFNLTIWTIFVGLVAGFGGYLLGNYLLPGDSANYFNINNPDRTVKVNIEQPLINVSNKYHNTIAGVYKPSLAVAAVGQSLFSKDDFLGSAVVVTSDGWLMTTNQVTTSDNVSIVLGDKIYKASNLVQDLFSGVVFLKIDENSLQPVNFQLIDNFKTGETLFTSIDLVNTYEHSFKATYLSNPHYSVNKYLFTDTIDYYIDITDTQVSLGAPYFNLDGNLIGLAYNVNNDTVLLPSEYIKQAVKHLLNNTERSKLGLRYVDMENNSGFSSKGNLVYNPQYAAIVYNSPAYKAGLKSGDQIVAINNDVVSSYRTLTSILQDYRPGDTIVVKILRENTEQDIEVTL